MGTRRQQVPDLYVLDALANDVEDLESILRMLNSDSALGWAKEWGRLFIRSEVVEALTRLVARELVEVLRVDSDGRNLEPLGDRVPPPGNYDDVYFAMTERGRLVHQNWQPEMDR